MRRRRIRHGTIRPSGIVRRARGGDPRRRPGLAPRPGWAPGALDCTAGASSSLRAVTAVHTPLQTPAQVQGMFGRIAGRYDLLNRVLSARRDVAWRRAALGMIEGAPQDALDLATGTFDVALELIARGKAQRVHASDFCQPMLVAGGTKRAGKPVTASLADAMRLPFADASFDLASVAYGWRNFPDPALSARELSRVLRPGGQLLIIEFFRPVRWWPRLFSATFNRAVMPAAGFLLAGDASAYRYLHRSIRAFASTDEADGILRSAGFARTRWMSFFGGISHAVHAVKDGGIR